MYDETGELLKSLKQYFDNDMKKKRPYSSYDLSKWIDTKAVKFNFDPAVLHRAISENQERIFIDLKKTENLKNPYFSKQNKILISDEWKILERSQMRLMKKV